MTFNVSYSKYFLNKISTLTGDELMLIGIFIFQFSNNGFSALPGRNKASTGVSKKHVNRIKLIQYAIKNNLWHYHVGHIKYNQAKSFGDWTSEYVVHYQKLNNNSIRLVSYSKHPPFIMPKPSTLI
ncbi:MULTISPECIES: hypothetical protein [Klebsiella]|uniref:hypothetical protein n=1 Tax=Klebsiella pneumoniae complex TaxID=3390273 RepID=UPI0023DC6AFA|nr:MULTISPECIES: hypothetical protein [Klebsiella]MDF1915393.1 hypothetical protein [Klebsiella pneumoniae]HCF8431174.1 hypothetical protein [Klebsiella pneumoniae]HCF8652778.1 hypothetical protein [Klebsiella pneumoniae]HCF9026974.1 hypothetical protein [Klebsiella pneumoniae]